MEFQLVFIRSYLAHYRREVDKRLEAQVRTGPDFRLCIDRKKRGSLRNWRANLMTNV